MASPKPFTFVLPSGRTLSYSTYGCALTNSSQHTIFYFHGFPSSRLEGTLWDDAAQTLGVRLIAIDRPGMGYSTFQENRTLLDWPKDLLALADHLAIPQFGVFGISGGGPYVLACLATIPADRLKFGAAVCGIYPLNLGARNMIFQSWILLWAGRWVPWLLHPMLERLLGNAARDADNSNRFKEIIKAQLSNENLPQVDNDCLKSLLQNEATLSAYTDCIRESLRESARGATHEAGIYGADWGFPLSQVDKSRLVIWHGVLDRNVPIDMADKAVNIIHPLVYNRVEGQGHASLPFGHREDILKSVTMQMVVEQ